jgi:hypothetical protein
MQRKNFLLVLAVILFPLAGAFSQTASMNITSLENQEPELLDINGENWTFYLDKESKVYYIDFETISVNLSDIQVKNEEGIVVLQDKLWDLPVNTIYELDMSKWLPGKYRVELRTYTSVIAKDLNLAE